MATINPTVIATSLPLDIGNINSIPYFPETRINFGVSNIGNIVSVNPTILAWNFKFSVSYLFYAGLQGPAIALQYTVDGMTEGNSFTGTVTKDRIEGGILFGIKVGFQVSFTINQAALHWVKDGWHSHFEVTWNEKFNAHAEVSFDLISIILGIVARIFDEEGKQTIFQEVNNINTNLLGSYGLFDRVSNGFAGTGNFSINPGFSLPLNLVPFIPPLEAINLGLKALLGGLFLGPTVGIAIPATVRLKALEVGGQTYPLRGDGSSQIGGTSSGSGQGGNILKMDMERSPAFDFTLGFGVNLSVLKLFSLGASVNFDILGLLGIRPDLGTFPFSLSNTLGSNTVGDLSSLEMEEVILEWPA